MEDELLQTILADVGCRSKEQVHIFTSEDKTLLAIMSQNPKDRLQAQTIRVGNDIIRVASLHVRQELVKALQAVTEKLPPDLSPEMVKKICQKDESVKFWEAALYRVEERISTFLGSMSLWTRLCQTLLSRKFYPSAFSLPGVCLNTLLEMKTNWP